MLRYTGYFEVSVFEISAVDITTKIVYSSTQCRRNAVRFIGIFFSMFQYLMNAYASQFSVTPLTVCYRMPDIICPTGKG